MSQRPWQEAPQDERPWEDDTAESVAGEVAGASTEVNKLGEVGRLANLLLDADAAVEDAERDLAKAKERARQIREEALPGAMEEVGLTKVTLDNGATISTALEVYVSIPVPNRERAYAWLDEHEFGGLIKSEVGVSFGRSEIEHARELLVTLKEQGFQADLSQSVHSGTLKAWAKEQLSAGADLPLELFGARPVTIAKVKLPKVLK